MRSRRLRASFYDLPRSRLRTYFVAGFYHRVMEQFRDGDVSFAQTLDQQGQWTLFDFATYVGRAGAIEMLTGWRDSFSPPVFELVEFVNPPGAWVCLTLSVGGLGASSGVELESLVYLVIYVHRGMSGGGGFYRDKKAALAAAGLASDTGPMRRRP